MYAVIQSGGQQFRVSEGDNITVDRLSAEEGSSIEFKEVMMVGGDDGAKIGTPYVKGAKVCADVVEHARGEKRETYRYNRRHRTRKSRGFRAAQTILNITSISA
jgi:large subunit ribosomal protein L21